MRLTTAQALVRYLSRQYATVDGKRARLIPRMLGIFGHGNAAGLGQALAEYHAEMPYVQGRNEQSLVHMAVGYAKALRRRSALAVTSSIGPGATNMVTGAALATINRLPVLLLPADSYATRRQGPVLQQLEHPGQSDVTVNDCFRPVARFFDRITRPEQLLAALPEAMRVLTSPAETGAVVLSLPQDVQSEAGEFPEGFFAERVWPNSRPQPSPDQVATVTRLLARASRPLIIAGGGVIYSAAEDALASLASQAGIPVVETFGGKGAVQEDTWWNLGGLGLEGNPAANALAAEADLVLHVGTRLTDFATASQSLFADPGVRFAGINVTDRDARKQGAVPVVGDARLALAALAEVTRQAGVRTTQAWQQRARETAAQWHGQRARAIAADGSGKLTQGQLIGLLQESAQPGDTVIAAAGAAPGDLLKVWDATGGRRCHLEFGYSCMGYELPAALGVRMAQPDGSVIALIGDGTFLMQPSELATAAQEHLDVTIVISENHGFQVIRRLQEQRAGESFGTEFRYRSGGIDTSGLDGGYLKLDLAGIAAGLGADVVRAATASEVRQALACSRTIAGPAVIVVTTVPHADLPPSRAWWDVAPAEISGQPGVRTQRQAYEAERGRQRWHG